MRGAFRSAGTIRRSILRLPALGIPALALWMLGSSASGQKAQTPSVTAVLAKCQQCHGETLQMSHLSLVTRDSILKGGDHGPAIIPGDAAASPLYQRITGQMQPAMPMAPLPRLTSEEIAAVKEWIDAGASMADTMPLLTVSFSTGALRRFAARPSRVCRASHAACRIGLPPQVMPKLPLAPP